MARIQVLPLTPKTVGAITETPFVLVIDQADLNIFPRDGLIALKAEIGAMSVLITEDTLTVDNALELPDESRQAIEQRITAALV